ncbi:LLM class flavin-dependent oxidoreductase [Acuticoccus mangrovi]|uniref:LLM class flavin-dependent oxidoreductase n=1 Tax=Acuticoccus mangrovi TaxID=2796142 RepID=A0A934MLW2_9HYPH|nr:LLM class flavin-dependent oxidoreductase [Acuticoccus mangrovi]MBJ3776729.1 LLM class flavin-dependent oxidoreductase [Acuticoccus mangrovi]
MDVTRKMRLGLSMRGVGYHPSAWLDPAVPADGAINFPYYLEVAQKAESGLLDLVFLADQSAITVSDEPRGAFGRTPVGAEFEPITLLSALSQFTTHIGLVATASTTLHQPFQLARQFGSLDHLSGGRAGWNVVTSSRDSEAQNFSEERILPKDQRYRRAREALDVAFGLWQSWEEDAFVRDRARGVFVEPAKMHPIDHVGEFFRVKGPLNQPPTPQGRPVIVQAGASADGMDFAARYAEVVYAVQNRLADAQTFYAAMKARVAASGRNPDDVKIMPGILPVIGQTHAEAEDRYRAMQNEIDPLVGLEKLVRFFGDLSDRDLDGPPPELRTDMPVISRGELLLNLARENGWSIRQLYQYTSIGNAHHVVVGTPSEIVDVMETWFTEGAADGFNVLPAKQPADIHGFVDHIVPELQNRGLFRTEYEGKTLRGNLGLPAVASRHKHPQEMAAQPA